MEEIGIEIGHRISSRSGVFYRVIQKLGIGGNSVVFLVHALGGEYRGVLFALRIFTRLAKRERLDRFLQEAQFLRNCSHPSIMRIFDDGIYSWRSATETKEFPFVIVEYLPNTLFAMMRRGMTSAERVSYTLQLLSGLSHLDAHNPPVVHRDIKPKNIFVKGKSCVLGDFGLMKFLKADGAETDTNIDIEIYRESSSIGMPFFYRTPDLVSYVKKEQSLTTKSDVFQLGLVLTEMFTGFNPEKQAENLLDTVELRPIGEVPGAMAVGIRGLLDKMLEYNPEIRPRAIDLIDQWEGIFQEVVKQCHQLDGRVF